MSGRYGRPLRAPVEVDLCRHLSMKTIRQIALARFLDRDIAIGDLRPAAALRAICRLRAVWRLRAIGNVRLRKHLRQHAFDQGQAGAVKGKILAGFTTASIKMTGGAPRAGSSLVLLPSGSIRTCACVAVVRTAKTENPRRAHTACNQTPDHHRLRAFFRAR